MASQSSPSGIAELLASIWHDPKTGFTGAAELFRRAHERNPAVSTRQVRDWLRGQYAAQVVHRETRPARFMHIEAGPTKPVNGVPRDQLHQMDTLYMTGSFQAPSGVKYLLNVIDVHSRYVVSIPMTNRRAVDTRDALEYVYGRAIMWMPMAIETDDGSEFKAEFLEWCTAHGIRVRQSATGYHRGQGIIERFHRTLQERLTKYLDTEGHKVGHQVDDWQPVLGALIHGYNTSFHRSIGTTPENVYVHGAKPHRPHEKRAREGDPLQPGQAVRVLLPRPEGAAHRRAFHDRFSDELYVIGEVEEDARGVRLYRAFDPKTTPAELMGRDSAYLTPHYRSELVPA